MNQILVTEKLYVTPQIKRKKLIYKIEFFLSVFLVCLLFSYYIYAEYDRNKTEQVSQQILEQLNYEEDTTVRKTAEENAIIVILDEEYAEPKESNTQENNGEENNNNANSASENKNTNKDINKNNNKIDTKVYKTKSGVEYTTVAILKIPTINLEYPIISSTSADTEEFPEELLNISLCYFWGKNGPNEVGNYCIVGHYYRSGKLFGNLHKLENGDIAELTDLTGRTIQYEVYNRKVVKPTDTSCTSQLTNGRKELTLITCTNNGKERLVVKLREVN